MYLTTEFIQRYVKMLECLQLGQYDGMEGSSVPDFISLKFCCWVLRPPTCPVSVFPVFSESRTGSAFLLDTCTASHLPPLILHVIQQGYYYTNDSVDKREGKFYKIKFFYKALTISLWKEAHLMKPDDHL